MDCFAEAMDCFAEHVIGRASRDPMAPNDGYAVRPGSEFATPGLRHLRAQPNFLNGIKVIWAVQSNFKKYWRFSPKQITSLVAPSRSNEGRLAIVTNAGRDAVDAVGAFDEQHLSGRRSRVVLMPRRWHQVGR